MKKTLLILFFAALAVRLFMFGGLLYIYGPGSFYLDDGRGLTGIDTQDYVTIAKNLAEHGVYSRFADPPFEPDAMRTPAMPLYYMFFIAVFGLSGMTAALLVLNILLSFTAILAYKLGRLYLRHRLAFVFAFIVAVHPLLAYRTNIAEADGLFFYLFLLATYLFSKFVFEKQEKYLYLCAAALGALALTKPTGVAAAALTFVFLIYPLRKLENARKKFVFAVAVFALIISPWLLRNFVTFGKVSMSSIGSYHFASYLTGALQLPNEPEIATSPSDREPIRNLKNSAFYKKLAWNRVKNNPEGLARDYAVGMIRNAFSNDLQNFYYNGHAKLLPFSYNPIRQDSVTDLFKKGDFKAALKNFSAANIAFYVLLCLFYAGALIQWARSWFHSRERFYIFTCYLIYFAYFLSSSGPLVDPKYRMPGLVLLLIVFLSGKSSKDITQVVSQPQSTAGAA